jgi:hypothetical protein
MVLRTNATAAVWMPETIHVIVARSTEHGAQYCELHRRGIVAYHRIRGGRVGLSQITLQPL